MLHETSSPSPLCEFCSDRFTNYLVNTFSLTSNLCYLRQIELDCQCIAGMLLLLVRRWPLCTVSGILTFVQ